MSHTFTLFKKLKKIKKANALGKSVRKRADLLIWHTLCFHYSLDRLWQFISVEIFNFGGNTDVSCQIFLQEQFDEQPYTGYTVRGRQSVA